MPLPYRTTVDDVIKIGLYLLTKPTGATVTEAKKVLGAPILDSRKLTAYKLWGLITDEGGRLKLTPEGRNAVRNNQEGLAKFFLKVLGSCKESVRDRIGA